MPRFGLEPKVPRQTGPPKPSGVSLPLRCSPRPHGAPRFPTVVRALPRRRRVGRVRRYPQVDRGGAGSAGEADRQATLVRRSAISPVRDTGGQICRGSIHGAHAVGTTLPPDDARGRPGCPAARPRALFRSIFPASRHATSLSPCSSARKNPLHPRRITRTPGVNRRHKR